MIKTTNNVQEEKKLVALVADCSGLSERQAHYYLSLIGKTPHNAECILDRLLRHGFIRKVNGIYFQNSRPDDLQRSEACSKAFWFYCHEFSDIMDASFSASSSCPLTCIKSNTDMMINQVFYFSQGSEPLLLSRIRSEFGMAEKEKMDATIIVDDCLQIGAIVLPDRFRIRQYVVIDESKDPADDQFVIYYKPKMRKTYVEKGEYSL